MTALRYALADYLAMRRAMGSRLAIQRDGFADPHPGHDQGLITVRRGKFGKSRELPLHPSATAAVGQYLQRADRPTPPQHTAALFVSTAGTRLLYIAEHS